MSWTWVFDVDDTLYLERDYVVSGFRAVDRWAQETLHVDGVARTAGELFTSGRRRTTITDAFELLGRPLTPSETASAVSVYRHHAPDIRLCDDAAGLLATLVPERTAIITDGPRASQRAKIAALGVDRLVSLLVVTEEHGPDWHKPSTTAFEHVQRTLGAAPGTCVYVADNPAKDFAGPAALGWRTVHVIRPGAIHATSTRLAEPVDLVVADFQGLRERLHGA